MKVVMVFGEFFQIMHWKPFQRLSEATAIFFFINSPFVHHCFASFSLVEEVIVRLGHV
jgi:hypothetical protein